MIFKDRGATKCIVSLAQGGIDKELGAKHYQRDVQ